PDEAAIDEPEPDPEVRRLVRAVVLEGFLTRLGFGIVSFALPLQALQLGLSLAEVGFLAGAKAMVEPLVKPIVGVAVDRFGVRRCYLASVIVRAVAAVFLFFASSLAGLVAVRLLQGAAAAARDPASITALTRQAKKRLGRTFSLTVGAKDLGDVSAGVVGGGILATTGNDFGVLWAVVLVISVLPIFVIWRGVHDFEDPAGSSLPVPETAAVPEKPGRILADPDLRLIAGLGLMTGFTAHMMHSLFQVYAKEVAGLGEGQIGLIYSASVVGLLIVGPLAGYVGDRYGTGLLAGARGLTNALSSVIFVAFPSFPGVLAGRLVDDSGKAAFRPTWGSLVAGAASRSDGRRGRTAAGLDTALSVGEAAGPLVAGLIWDVRGFVTVFVVRAILGVATELTLGRRLRNRPAGSLTRAVPTT
ncbi:MAG: transporter, partial [Acidimicrobiales bacterium]|nr:transporter [Acidimicrobiales bacterium]